MKSVAVFALAAACSSSSVSFDLVSQELQGAVCQHEGACGLVEVSDCNSVNLGWVQHAIQSGNSGDALLPVLRLAEDATDPQVVAAVSNGLIHYDAGNAQSCIDGITAMSCDVSSQSRRVTPASCFGILVGTVAANGGCQRDEECASSSCNTAACADPEATCCTGAVCQDVARSPVPAGGACSFASCGEGSYCDDTSHCAALKARGATCDTDTTSPGECDYGLGCANGVCAPLPSFGQACTGACTDEDAVCSHVCTEVGYQGQFCAGSGSGLVTCSQFYPCDATGSAQCSSIPGDSGSCIADDCLGGDFCNFGNGSSIPTCAPPEAIGDACGSDDQCTSGVCSSTGSCVAPPTCS